MIIIVSFGEIVGGILFIVGLLMLLLMSATSNYTDIGFTMGFAILGALMLVISLGLIIMRLKYCNDKKEKIKCLIHIFVLLISGIVGYLFPAYSSKFNIAYSNLMSIFVKPIFVYLIVLLINFNKSGFMDDLGDSIFHLVFLGLSLCMFILGGVALMGINYFAGNDSFLEWADKNFRYENRIMINHRLSKYETEDFNTIIEIDLKNAKKHYEEEKLDYESIKEEFLKSPYGFSFDLDDYQVLDNKDEYLCTFIDKSRYGDNGEFPRYFAKINIRTLELIEIVDDQSGTTNDEEKEYLKFVENEKETTIYNAIKYASINLKNKNIEITQDNINNQLKYLKDTSIKCSEVVEKDKNTYIVTMRLKREKFMSPMTLKESKFTIDKTTYELHDYYEED